MKTKSAPFQRIILIAILFVSISFGSYAQNFNNIVNYNLNGSPVYGVKIKTNIPFNAGAEMPTITIQGFNYETNATIGLQICFYIYYTGSTLYYPAATISSFGSYAPPVYLANENGLVVIFINDQSYFQRFTVSAYSVGFYTNVNSEYTGWTVVDQALNSNATNQILLPYQNRFAGKVAIGIGVETVNPGNYMLAVEGGIHSQQVNVDMAGWSDFVFKKDYHLPTLAEVKTYIDQNHHLPEIPSEQQVVKDGVNLGEMDKLLTKKLEELTLYLIEKDKQLESQQALSQTQATQLSFQQKEIDELKQQVSTLINTKP